MVIARALIVAACAIAPVIPVPQGPPVDREVRTTKDAFTNDTLTTLTLMLAGPKGPLPINMAITTVRKAKPGAGPAVDYRLSFDMPMYAGPLDQKAPQVAFELDGRAGPSFTVDPRATPPSVTHIVASRFSSGDLSRLAGAATIRGRLFGVEFALTPQQIRAIREFAQRNSSASVPGS